MKLLRWLTLAVLGTAMLTTPSPSQAAQVAVGVSIRIGPPALPVYVQPPCPEEGYIWVPGYWAYGPDGYFWVPGTWVLAPEPGYLWTPGYWAFDDGFYFWHAGYWGPHVGFYGGINYGFGYPGTGFYGGYWNSGRYYYNRSVTNINVTVIHNTYNRTVINERNVTRVSFNGRGGINARPTREDRQWERERHFQATSLQREHQQSAERDRRMFASENHGRPDIGATARPGDFHGRDNVRPDRGNNRDDRPRGDVNRPGNRDDRPHGNGAPERNRNDRPPNAGGNDPRNVSRPDRTFPNGRNDRPPSVDNNRRNESRPDRGVPNDRNDRPNMDNRRNESRPDRTMPNGRNDRPPNANARRNDRPDNRVNPNQGRVNPNQARPDRNSPRNERINTNEQRPSQHGQRPQDQPRANPNSQPRGNAQGHGNAPRPNDNKPNNNKPDKDRGPHGR